MLKIYNTLTRKKEDFKPLKKGEVKLYGCGPTVYWYQHIGNMRRYIFEDTLKRILLFDGYKVKHVINVTDVGHLTSDEDTGEDKVEKAAKLEGKKASDITRFYFDVFKEDLEKLNILMPDIWSWATEHIKEQIELIKKLEEKGYTYKTKDGIYFNTSKLKDYGKLAKLKIKGLKAGKRISVKEKKNPTDFALWKFSEKPGLRQQEWDSPWGVGFPGWHIECSAMSMKYFGETLDMHTGGEEHIPVHHTNEIAQAEAATGKKFVNYWLHMRWLVFKGEKMSKSKGEIYTISELEKKGFEPLEYRYFCLSAHYRSPLDFSIENLKNAKNTYERLKNIACEIEDDKKEDKKYLKEFKKVINDDLDTPKALQVLWNLIRDKKAQGKLNTIKEIDKVLGLNLLEKEEIVIPEHIQKIVDKREEARLKKDWKKADKLRNELKEKGYEVKDTDEGPKVKIS